jgi:hypothetical protein
MITPLDIRAGNSYSCKFTVNIPLDSYGRPGGLYSMTDLPVQRYGDYTSTGDIVARDLNTELFEVRDHESKSTFVVKFADTQDIEIQE